MLFRFPKSEAKYNLIKHRLQNHVKNYFAVQTTLFTTHTVQYSTDIAKVGAQLNSKGLLKFTRSTQQRDKQLLTDSGLLNKRDSSNEFEAEQSETSVVCNLIILGKACKAFQRLTISGPTVWF
jgi:hypothetical protein